MGLEIVPYVSEDGSTKVNVEVDGDRDTMWLTQAGMAILFEVARNTITTHLGNIFGSGELDQETNVRKADIPSSDKPVAYYSLDAIISVGYRVNSKRAIDFLNCAKGVQRGR